MNKVNKLSPEKNEFLQSISVIAKSPKCLWYIGKLPKKCPTVAIIGSRKPTKYGEYVTLKLASELASRGVIIVSGLALGHDALAARGALNGGGITVAVLGNGLNEIYPRSNQHLADEIIAKGGAIISEFEPDFPVRKENFLMRNRIVSGLADVVVVVEAGVKSGTLNTAMHALDQNKELMAVPGNITSPLSVGCNRLIAQGATPVTCTDDILEKLGMTSINDLDISTLGENEIQNKIIALIRKGVIDGDNIIAESKIDITDFNQNITMMEISGLVKSLGANCWTLK